MTVNHDVAGSSPAGGAKDPECESVRDFTFSLFTLHFSLPPAGVSSATVCFANFRRFSPVAVVCRGLSPAPARLCPLALWATPLAKTILNCFHCANPAGGVKQNPLSQEGGFLFVLFIFHYSSFIIHLPHADFE